jgi:hypothetical protein
MAAASESDTVPAPSPSGLVVVSVSVTHPRSMTSRFLPSIRATGPAFGVPEARP